MALPFLVGLGYIFFCNLAFRCDIFEAHDERFNSQTGQRLEPDLIGVYGYRGLGDEYDDSGGKCLELWDEVAEMPGAIRAGRAVGILGGIIGAVAFLVSMYAPFFYVPKAAFKTMGIVLSIVMTLLTLTLFFLGLLKCGPFKDRSSCQTSIRESAYLAIPTWVTWLGILIWFLLVKDTRRVAAGVVAPASPKQLDYPPPQQQQQGLVMPPQHSQQFMDPYQLQQQQPHETPYADPDTNSFDL